MTGPASVGAAAEVFVTDLEGHDTISVTAADGHHLSHVLRLRPGESVVASDGAGAWRLCRFRGGDETSGRVSNSLQRSRSNTRTRRGADRPLLDLLTVDGPVVHEPEPQPKVTVGFVPAKGDRSELVVQKLTELGVDRMAVVRSSRAVVHWDEPRAQRAVSKLRRVAREAAAQSRRAWLPEVVGVLSLKELCQLVEGGVALAEPGAAPPDSNTTAIAIGPEGGWDDEELALARTRVGLSPLILRAETAAIVAGFALSSVRTAARTRS